MNKGIIGIGIAVLMLAVLCYVYEQTVYIGEFFGMKIPKKIYPFRKFSFILGFFGIVIFGVGFVCGEIKQNGR